MEFNLSTYFNSFEFKLHNVVFNVEDKLNDIYSLDPNYKNNIFHAGDEMFLNDYKNLKIRKEFPLSYSHVLNNIHFKGNDNITILELSENEIKYLTLIENNLIKKLNELEINISEIKKYYINLGETFYVLCFLYINNYVNNAQFKIIVNALYDTNNISLRLSEILYKLPDDFYIVKDNNEIIELIRKVIKENEKSVIEYKSGKEKAIMPLVGSIMKIDKSLNGKELLELLKKEINTDNE